MTENEPLLETKRLIWCMFRLLISLLLMSKIFTERIMNNPLLFWRIFRCIAIRSHKKPLQIEKMYENNERPINSRICGIQENCRWFTSAGWNLVTYEFIRYYWEETFVIFFALIFSGEWKSNQQNTRLSPSYHFKISSGYFTL